jgi:hypothetical protein
MAKTSETFYWSEDDNTKGVKFMRFARDFRSETITRGQSGGQATDGRMYVRMMGLLPPAETPFDIGFRRNFSLEMQKARDTLIGLGVLEKAIDGYMIESPITEFVYTLEGRSDRRVSPFPGFPELSLKDVPEKGEGPAKYVIDPFRDDDQLVKVQLEVNIFDQFGMKKNQPGELKATFELKQDQLKEVGVEWSIIKGKIGSLGQSVRNIEFEISVAGKVTLTERDVENIFKRKLGGEAKASLSAGVTIGPIKTKVELGAKADSDGKVKPVLEFSW